MSFSGQPHLGNSIIWKYKIDSNTYEQVSGQCFSCSWSGYTYPLVSIGSNIYHIDISQDKPFEVYKPAMNQWSEQGQIPNDAKYQADMISHDNKLYVLGGSEFDGQGNEYSDDSFIRYNIDTNIWTNLSPYPERVTAPIMVSDGDDFIYAVGGYKVTYDGTSTPCDGFYRYQVSANQWTKIGEIDFQTMSYRKGNSALILQERFLVVNMFSQGKIQVYDMEENKWRDEPINTGSFQAILEVNNQVYFAKEINYSSTNTYSHRFYKMNLINLPN